SAAGVLVSKHVRILRHADRVEVVGNETRSRPERLSCGGGRQRVRETSGGGIDLRFAISPRVPDDAQTGLPLIVEAQDGLTCVVACPLSIPAQTQIDRQTR